MLMLATFRAQQFENDTIRLWGKIHFDITVYSNKQKQLL